MWVMWLKHGTKIRRLTQTNINGAPSPIVSSRLSSSARTNRLFFFSNAGFNAPSRTYEFILPPLCPTSIGRRTNLRYRAKWGNPNVRDFSGLCTQVCNLVARNTKGLFDQEVASLFSVTSDVEGCQPPRRSFSHNSRGRVNNTRGKRRRPGHYHTKIARISERGKLEQMRVAHCPELMSGTWPNFSLAITKAMQTAPW